MMKKLALVLAIVLAMLGCVTAFADAQQDNRIGFRLDSIGMDFYLDLSWADVVLAGKVKIGTGTEYDDAGALKSGMLVVLPTEYITYTENPDDEPIYDFKGAIMVVTVLAEGVDIDESVVSGKLEGYEQDELGSVEGYVFTRHINTAPDTQLLDDESMGMIDRVRASVTAEAADCIAIRRPYTVTELNTLIKDFTAQDLFGNTVDKSILSAAPYTLINVWATSCPPCINEMPDTSKLAEEYEGRVQFVGLLTDGVDEDTRELARMIVEKTGTKYPTLLLNSELNGMLMYHIMYTPTKILVDSQGVMVGEPIVGSLGTDRLRTILDELTAE